MVPMTFISCIYHFWARFWPYFNFVDFWAYFCPFSLVKWGQTSGQNLAISSWPNFVYKVMGQFYTSKDIIKSLRSIDLESLPRDNTLYCTSSFIMRLISLSAWILILFRPLITIDKHEFHEDGWYLEGLSAKSRGPSVPGFNRPVSISDLYCSI